ncbi:MAG: DUF4351 domain-containing protein [Nostocales cyanobacterium ELA583]|jgi:hypothetical protein
MLRKLLRRRMGELSPGIKQQIQSLSVNQLENLALLI